MDLNYSKADSRFLKRSLILELITREADIQASLATHFSMVL